MRWWSRKYKLLVVENTLVHSLFSHFETKSIDATMLEKGSHSIHSNGLVVVATMTSDCRMHSCLLVELLPFGQINRFWNWHPSSISEHGGMQFPVRTEQPTKSTTQAYKGYYLKIENLYVHTWRMIAWVRYSCLGLLLNANWHATRITNDLKNWMSALCWVNIVYVQ